MEVITIFFSTPLGISVSSLVTISSFIYAILQKSKSIKMFSVISSKNIDISILEIKITELSQKIILIDSSNDELKLKNSKLISTITSLENNDLSHNKKSINQTGKNNISNGDIDGDVTLNIS